MLFPVMIEHLQQYILFQRAPDFGIEAAALFLEFCFRQFSETLLDDFRLQGFLIEARYQNQDQARALLGFFLSAPVCPIARDRFLPGKIRQPAH